MIEGTYLGHVVGNGVVKPEEGKLKAIAGPYTEILKGGF